DRGAAGQDHGEGRLEGGGRGAADRARGELHAPRGVRGRPAPVPQPDRPALQHAPASGRAGGRRVSGHPDAAGAAAHAAHALDAVDEGEDGLMALKPGTATQTGFHGSLAEEIESAFAAELYAFKQKELPATG